MVEATTAEARSVRGEVGSRIATLAAVADASAARATEEIANHVKQVAEYSDAQASHVTADVTQQLEHEIVAAVTSTATTAEVTMCTVVEGVRRDIQVQIEKKLRGCSSEGTRGTAQSRGNFQTVANFD